MRAIARPDRGCAINDCYKLILMYRRDRPLDKVAAASAISTTADWRYCETRRAIKPQRVRERGRCYRAGFERLP